MNDKGTRRAARKVAQATGAPLAGDLALPDDRSTQPIEFSETSAGYDARGRWARRYDDLNGAPDGDGDR